LDGLAMEDAGKFIWYILLPLIYFWQFGRFYGYLVNFMVIWYILPFWYVLARKIWQPRYSEWAE
jgi:hypothetical protein